MAKPPVQLPIYPATQHINVELLVVPLSAPASGRAVTKEKKSRAEVSEYHYVNCLTQWTFAPR